ncbi:MAG: hypothetical protein BGO41_15745 [Clostridiales bacterium 38-18]|nr:MAG: hypothetical protein BGO41_15745 [Clostridiales bacterium 38-18]
MIRVPEIKFSLDEVFCDDSVRKKILKKTKLQPEQLVSYEIIRESIDARKEIIFSYIVDIETTKEKVLLKNGFKLAPEPFVALDETIRERIAENIDISKIRPIVVGFGPAGIFASLELALAGLKPIVLEMGEPVEDRMNSVDRFWKTGELNPNSNVQFGEGGAGTFSDGKLTTRIKDPRIEWVLKWLVKSGAPNEIKYRNKPHIGTDLLMNVVKNLRNEIISLGGEIFFNHKVSQVTLIEDHLVLMKCENGVEFISNNVVFAIGHSARDLFEELKRNNIAMEQKPFAMGVRIEHPQELINAAQWGRYHNHSSLGAAEYKLTHSTSQPRSVYSFCMCPGGKVVASASEDGHLVVNGMSYHSRDLANANSALLVNIVTNDFEDSNDVLSGVKLQRKLERNAFLLGGNNYNAPYETVGSFLDRSHYDVKSVENYYNGLNINYNKLMSEYQASYTPGLTESKLTECIPDFMVEALKEALIAFEKKIPGFSDPRIVMTAVESRSSSPVRIIRNDNYESLSHHGIYPCGEGAGYAGGITSSAVDGLKVAEAIIKKVYSL